MNKARGNDAEQHEIKTSESKFVGIRGFTYLYVYYIVKLSSRNSE